MKIKLSNILDLSKYLDTKAGQDIKGVLEYLAQLADELITALTSNLSYADNFSCEIKKVDLRHNLKTQISVSKNNSEVKEIRVRRIYDDEYFTVSSFGWTNNIQGGIDVKLLVEGAPPITYELSVDLLILYG